MVIDLRAQRRSPWITRFSLILALAVLFVAVSLARM